MMAIPVARADPLNVLFCWAVLALRTRKPVIEEQLCGVVLVHVCRNLAVIRLYFDFICLMCMQFIVLLILFDFRYCLEMTECHLPFHVAWSSLGHLV
jgi:hypothetical protein